jgi:hypothetical protein
MTEEQKLKKLEALLAMMDFVTSFENVVKYVKKIEDKTAADFSTTSATLSAIADRIESDKNTTLADLKTLVETRLNEAILQVFNEQKNLLNFVRDKASSITNGKDGRDGTNGTNGKDGSPDTPAQVRDKLESLEDEERLDVSAIKGLDNYEELKTAIAEGKSVSVVTSPSRGIFLYIDGVKKGIISNMNLVAGTGMSIAYSKVNGQDTLTFNSSGGPGGGITVETPPETPDAVTTVFTVSDEPQWVVADGTTYFDGKGYSYAALQVTMEIPPSASIRVII